MPTNQDARIWCCAITQYAMSSGKFSAEEIDVLAQQAFQTFVNLFGVPEADVPRTGTGPVPHFQQTPAAPAPPPAASNGSSLPEPRAVNGQPFRVWANDKLKLGKDKQGPNGKTWAECTWAEAHQALAGRSSEKVVKWLEFLSRIEDKDPKWAAANATMRNRASALLETVPAPARDQTPF